MGDLSVNESRVLYGLVRWPSGSDRELGERLGLKRSTVTVIRNRLEGDDLLRHVVVPDFHSLGYEIFTSLYGEFTGAVHKLEDLGQAVKDGVSTAFYTVSAGGMHLSLGAARNLTDVRDHITSHLKAHHDSGYLTDKRHNYVLFPFKHTVIHRFFDYAPLLANHFGFRLHLPGENKSRLSSWNPGKKERATYNAMVANPGSTDAEIAKIAKVSRQTVNALKKKFNDSGLIRQLVIPDVRKLGYRLASFTHIHLNPHHDHDYRRPHFNRVLSDESHVLKMTGDFETVLMSVHKDYSDFRNSRDYLMGVYKKNNMLIEDPAFQVYPLSDARHYLEHDYTQLVDNILD